MTKNSYQLLSVLLLFPLAYIVVSLNPIAFELFVKGNSAYFIPFWTLIIFLHWTSLYIVYRFLKSDNETFSDIGYSLSQKGTTYLIVSYLAVAFSVFGLTELGLKNVEINTEKLDQISNFFPKTTSQRLLFIFSVFSAAFCEELIYRAYAISKLVKLGLNKWLAIIISGISFVFIHGVVGFTQFWFYFIPALIFGLIYLIFKKRILANILLHLLYNLIGMMAVFQAVDS